MTGNARRDVIVNARSILQATVPGSDPSGMNVRLGFSVMSEDGLSWFCGDWVDYKMDAGSTAPNYGLSIPVQLQDVCRLEAGVYVLTAFGGKFNSNQQMARFDKAIIDIH